MASKTHIFLFFFSLIFPLFLYSQGEFNNWYFGWRAGITFNGGSPTGILDGQLITQRSNATASDTAGNLWFYTDGMYVWNRNHVFMPNGTGLHGNSTCNQTINVIRKIDDDSSYYLFTMGTGGISSGAWRGLHYSVINMRLDGGLGDIEPSQKEIALQGQDDVPSMMGLARHSNNRDAWVVVRNTSTDESYKAFLVSPSGVNPVPVTSPSGFLTGITPWCNQGNMRISPDGIKLVYPYFDTIEVCNFNSATGQVSHTFFMLRNYIPGYNPYCSYMEFSTNSRFLYVSDGDWPNDTVHIVQYDLSIMDSAIVAQSAIIVGTNPHGSHLQRGSDGKIYCDVPGVDSLCVINDPNLPGLACNYQKNAISLKGRNCQEGLPAFLLPYYVFINDTGRCQGSPVQFTPRIWPPADSVHWDFGDPASGASNFSNLLNPVHIYNNPGTYIIHLFVRHNDNRTDTASKSLVIFLSPVVSLGTDRTVCEGDSVIFDAGVCSGCTYVWSNITLGLPNIGTTQTYTAKTTAQYMVTVTNSFGCIGRDTVNLLVTPPPVVINNPLSKTICSGESTNIQLTSNVSGTVFYWIPSLISGNITGFLADSGTVINQVLIDNLATPGMVKYSITPKIGTCVGPPVDYLVTINQGDSAKVSIVASVNNVCAGTPVTFTATPTYSGATPVYQWKVNGVNAGSNSPVFSYAPANGDQVQCILTSSILVCISNNPATSNTITMTVLPLLPVSVSVSASSNSVCAGTSVVFTAIPTNGGSAPVYQWKVNGIPAGTNSPVYTYVPVNNDIVTCVLTSSESCTAGNPAASPPVTMTVSLNLPVSVTISPSSNPFCIGTSVTFTAVPANGGTPPVYQWKVNGVNVGTNSSSFTYNPLDNDSVRCVMTSNLSCVSGNPASSNEIILSGSPAPVVTFTSCFDTFTTLNARSIKLKGGIPLNGIYSGPGVNPATGLFTPSTAGIGIKTITYTYTNFALCSASKTRSIQVVAAPLFTCGNNLTDIRDNKVYPTIQIGSQCWMASNLNYGSMISGNSHQRDNCIPEKYLQPPPNLPRLGEGSVYQWDELMGYSDTEQAQGLCPPGWHVPTEAEWQILFANWTNNAFAGAPLKYSGYSGFNALLSGVNHLNRQWDFANLAAFFWSSTAYGPYKAWAHGMNDYDPSVSLYSSLRSNAFSVRCLKD